MATEPERSGNAATDYDAVIERASRQSVFGPITRWAAHVEGTLVGLITVSLPAPISRWCESRCIRSTASAASAPTYCAAPDDLVAS
ncbi:MAG TPA: hypothetical protein VGN81_15205 [Pseudonocardiaceae bacterium]